MRKALLIPAALAALTALVVAGCGGGSSSSASSSGGYTMGGKEGTSVNAANPEATVAAAAARTVSLRNASGVGRVLVDSRGMTLYLFEKDRRGSGKSTCAGACAVAWPPLIGKGKPRALSGVMAAKLGTIRRADGTMQATYNGWPLYTFFEDHKPGEANGTGLTNFGGGWFPLHASGATAGN